MTKTLQHTFLLSLLIFIGLAGCSKKDKLTENVDPDAVSFVLTQTSLASATFIAQCTNYDVIVDSVIFLDPNSAIYYQNFNSSSFSKNEEFQTGGFTAVDGMWIIQFRGSIQTTNENYDVSIPYDMNIEGNEE